MLHCTLKATIKPIHFRHQSMDGSTSCPDQPLADDGLYGAQSLQATMRIHCSGHLFLTI